MFLGFGWFLNDVPCSEKKKSQADQARKNQVENPPPIL